MEGEESSNPPSQTGQISLWGSESDRNSLYVAIWHWMNNLKK